MPVVRRWDCQLELSKCSPSKPHMFHAGCGWSAEGVQCDKCDARIGFDDVNWLAVAINLGWQIYQQWDDYRCPKHRHAKKGGIDAKPEQTHDRPPAGAENSGDLAADS